MREGTVYGGSELRAWRFARGLADLGFKVSIIGSDAEGVDPDILGPVSIVSPPSRNSILMSLARLFGRNGENQKRAWEAADADIFVMFGVAEYNAAVAEWCRSRARPSVLFAGSDADFSADYRPGNSNRNLWGSRCDRCYDAIRAATIMVVQTATQQRLLNERFGRGAEVIANPVPISAHPPSAPIGSRFLWIGKAVTNKRPDVALAVASACPDLSFTMIVNDVGNGLFEQIVSNSPPNVEIVPSVPPARIGGVFSDLRALLCTSDIEGFPNTFLDAGRFAVPVLSLSIDPDGIVARERAGFVAQGDINLLIQAARRFGAEAETARIAGIRLYEYVKRHHGAGGRISEFAGLLNRQGVSSKTLSRESA